jgi:hypothetical protein
VPEDANIEIAHKLSEGGPHGSKSSRHQLVEIAEAVVLALVAVATAWSGFQAAKWDGRQAYLYATSARLHVEAGVATSLGGQQRLLDVATFNTWIEAQRAGDRQLEALYVRRFSPEFRVAFDAWLKTDPFHSSSAPPGPSFMPEYHNPQFAQAQKLNDQGDAAFAAGTAARLTAEKYVGCSVLFATVLFLLAISQRFTIRNVRIAMLVLAGSVLAFVLGWLATFPRA